MAKSDLGAAKIEFLQADKVVSTMDISLKTGMNRFQWNMRGPVVAGTGRGGGGFGGGGGGGGRGGPPPQMVPDDPNAPPVPPGASLPTGRPAGPPVVPFVAAAGRGGGGGGGGGVGNFTPQGPVLDPGTFMIRLTAGTQTWTSSVNLLEDVWLRPQ